MNVQEKVTATTALKKNTLWDVGCLVLSRFHDPIAPAGGIEMTRLLFLCLLGLAGCVTTPVRIGCHGPEFYMVLERDYYGWPSQWIYPIETMEAALLVYRASKAKRKEVGEVWVCDGEHIDFRRFRP